MFTKMNRWQRFGMGFAIVLVALVAGFAIVIQAAITWGATPQEAAAALPGDELATDAYVSWDNSTTIQAPVDKVWPWIIQMGDTRAGYYSYAFIEKMVMQAFGLTPAELVNYYNNASSIHPEWQNPPLGQGLIMDILKVKSFEPNRNMVGGTDPGDFGWNWSWHLQSIDANTTRLHVRSRLQVPAAARSPLVTIAFSAGGFIMEQNMIQGIRQRAEGEGEPANIETIEIVLWLAALAAGLVSAGYFVFGRGQMHSLLVGLVTVLMLFVLTYVQPAIVLRVLIDLALWAAAGWIILQEHFFGTSKSA